MKIYDLRELLFLENSNQQVNGNFITIKLQELKTGAYFLEKNNSRVGGDYLISNKEYPIANVENWIFLVDIFDIYHFSTIS